ncbi:MAG TPA: hypothetical protein VL947_06570 [Cytophagales bacterium]|nr:hypothetical protein [Cytophagales bacterium]
MDLKKFKRIYKKIKAGGLDKNYWFSDEYAEFVEAMNNDLDCSIWYLKNKTKEAGIDYRKYCCAEMANRLIDQKKAGAAKQFDSDCTMRYDRSQKLYGLPIHDGGTSYISIQYCPWCGKLLKPPGTY